MLDRHAQTLFLTEILRGECNVLAQIYAWMSYAVLGLLRLGLAGSVAKLDHSFSFWLWVISPTQEQKEKLSLVTID